MRKLMRLNNWKQRRYLVNSRQTYKAWEAYSHIHSAKFLCRN